MTRLSAQLFLLAGMAVVGSYVALAKPLTALFPVFLLSGLRFSIALIAMLPWLKKPASEAPLSRRDQVDLFIQAFFGNFLFSVCMLYGIKLAGAVAGGVVLALIPAMVAVLSWVVLEEQVSRRTWGAVALSIIAIATLNIAQPSADTPPNHHNHVSQLSSAAQYMAGIALLLGAVFCESVYVIQAKKLGAKLSPMRLSALMNVIGWGLTLPFALWQLRDISLGQIGPVAWVGLVYYALAASVFSTWLWFKGLQTIPASQAGVFTLALPLTAAGLGVWLFAEPFGWAHAAAFALAVASVWLINSQGEHAKKA